MSIKKISELPIEEVEGHRGFDARSLIDLSEKGITVRMLSIKPDGIGPVPAHQHADIHFFLVLEGTLELDIDGHIHKIPKGSCIELPPHKYHQLRGTGKEDVSVLAVKWS
jgi:mannose-6-phosphate isomerase-like protein (cupin superfamily)